MESPDSRFKDDPLTVHGTPRKRKPRLTGKERSERVDFCVRLLLMQYRRDQIKGMFADQFKVRRRCAERYIAMARVRMRQIAEKTTQEAVQESLGDYAGVLQRAVERIEWLDKAIELQHQIILGHTKKIGEERRPTAQLTADEKRAMALLYEQREDARTMLREYRAERAARMEERLHARRETDRLLNSYPPIRVATTTTDGKDVEPPKASDAAQSRLAEIAAALRQRATIGLGGMSPSDN